jgi:hypothetical protein
LGFSDMAHLAISYSHIVKPVYHIRLSLPTVSWQVRRTLLERLPP